MSRYGVYSGPYFPAFVLNTERYRVSLLIQFKCGKLWTRKTPNSNTFHTMNCTNSNETIDVRDFCADLLIRQKNLPVFTKAVLSQFCQTVRYKVLII